MRASEPASRCCHGHVLGAVSSKLVPRSYHSQTPKRPESTGSSRTPCGLVIGFPYAQAVRSASLSPQPGTNQNHHTSGPCGSELAGSRADATGRFQNRCPLAGLRRRSELEAGVGLTTSIAAKPDKASAPVPRPFRQPFEVAASAGSRRLLAEAMRRISDESSVSSLFD